MAEVTMTHPTFPDVERSVPSRQAKRWEKAGWIRKPAPAGESASGAGKSTSRRRSAAPS